MKIKMRSAAMLALLAALSLTACSSKETVQGTAGTASGSTSADSKTAQVSKNEDKGSDASASAGSDGSGAAAADLPDVQAGEAENSGDTAAVSPEDTFDAMNQSGEEEAAASTGINWQGTYSSDSGETLTITVSDEHTIAFSFAVSGISGSADKDGNEAIYNGDDNVQVVFEHFDSSLTVTVLNAEGGVEESTVSGSYSRQ